MKMSFPCERHAIFRKTRDRSRSGIFTRKGAQVPQEIEPRLPKNIKGTLPITAQTSKSHFQRDRCVFGKSKKTNTVPEIAPGGVLPPRLKRTASKMSFPCKRHVDFPKARKWDFEPKKGVQMPLENDPGSDRGSQRKPQINQKSLRESPGRPDGHPASPKHPKGHPRRPFCLQKTSSDIISPPIWNMF